MKSTVLAFNKKINELKEHLLFDKKVQRDIADLLQKQEHVPESLKKMLRQPEKKIFDYKLSILILYGSFENFVENIIYSYLDKLNCNIERFIDLPKDIIDSHTDLSAKLLGYMHAGYGKYDQITDEEVVRKLYSCVSNAEKYKLNIIAFTHHSSNLRIDAVRELFNGIGLKGIDKKIIQENKFKKSIQLLEEDFREELGQKILLEKAFSKINEIVERRNDIAHGVDDADENILSVDVILTYCDYFISLVEAIYIIVLREYVTLMIQNKSVTVHELGIPIAVYNNSIICLNNKNIQIKNGNCITGKNSKDQVRVGQIISLQIEEKQVDYISEKCSVDFGARVDFYASEKDTYYLIDL